MSLQIWLPLQGNITNQGLKNATITSTVSTYGKSPLNKSATFSSNYIVIKDTPLVTGVNEFSFAFWYSTTSTANQCLYNGRTAVGSAVAIFNIDGKFRLDDGAQHTFTYTIPSNGSWHHYAFVRNATNIKFYVDGTLNQTVTSNSFTCTATYASIGMSSVNTASPSANNLIGGLCDYRIYDNCLSQKEIYDLSKGLCLHLPLKSVSGNPNLYPNSMTLEKSGSGGTFTQTYGEDGSGCKYTRLTCTATGYGTWFSQFNARRYRGRKCTITCYMRANKDVKKHVGHESGGLTYMDLTTSWKKFTYTWTVSGAGAFICYDNWAVGDWVDIKLMKIEEGDKSTPWCPNLYDTEYVSMGYGSRTLPYSLVGAPSNSAGLFSGFATNKYINLGTTFSWNGASTWDVYMRFITGSDVTTQQIFSNPVTGCSLDWGIKNGKFTMCLGSGSAWNILAADTAIFDVAASTPYYVKISFTGSAYKVLSSSTGFDSLTEVYSLTSSTKIANDGSNRIIGCNRAASLPYLGYFDMDVFRVCFNKNDIYNGCPTMFENAITEDTSGLHKEITKGGYFYPDSTTSPTGTGISFIRGGNLTAVNGFPTNAKLGPWTVSFWYKPDLNRTFTAWADVFKVTINTNAGNGTAFRLEVEGSVGSGYRIFYNNSGSSSYGCTGITLSESKWYHLAFCCNGTTLAQYVNGALTSNDTINTGYLPTGTTGRFQIGESGIWGSFSDVRVYGTCLTAADVKTLYTNPISITNDGKLICREFVET